MADSIEREIKLPFADARTARTALIAAGGVQKGERRLQHDELFDTPDGQLRSIRSVLRVRLEDRQSFVTFKGPVQAASMKVREEIETSIGDGANLMTILARLGFTVWFRYEKYREEFSLGDVIAAIDETPVGVYVELEGSEAGITAVARSLGFEPRQFVLDSYRGLFARQCEARGVSVTDMLFSRGAD